MDKNTMRRRAFIAAMLLAAVPASPVLADPAYPAKPIKLLVGFAAGGGSDVVARLVAKPLGERLGQAVIVENRAGDGGNIASAQVAKSEPDGYTLVLMTSGHGTNAAMRKDLPFDPIKSFSWISTVTTYPLTLAVAPASPIRSFGDFIQRIKAEPGRYTYTSVGVGTAMHLVGEWIMAESGGSALHVPFKGGAGPMTELLAGRVDVMIDTMTNTAPLFKSDRVRLLATTAPRGVQALPGVPSVADTLPAVVFESWLGIAAPAGTPAAVVGRLNRELRAVLEMPAIRQQLVDWGGSPQASGPDAFQARVEQDIQRLRAVVAQRKIQAE
ncbi:MAG: tripartite tricarboxylate transporter substrate-binding protein [Pigmentiphaga sp.]|uniref:Bug family tripartite tricarboxylate transporter substrate binding protein n=1 Tax=Pigmentiphaga sp. TaxID=1977564 RepID=UPI0029A5E133|nr:tripartite tricarboxylate transporter substrate-binding protein [Pigmentiphaga sp.]MDX3906676.1 tripartite tricarboxylate transporter substrate-binding protein [Pigmentiphaga sp.]